MKPQNESRALAVAATLIAQVNAVLAHATDSTAAMVKQGLARLAPLLPTDAPKVDESAFFGMLGDLHGAEFAEETQHGEKPAEAAPSANEAQLQQQLSEMRKQQAELNEKFEKLMAASAGHTDQKNA
jgi:hypothetical protein